MKLCCWHFLLASRWPCHTRHSAWKCRAKLMCVSCAAGYSGKVAEEVEKLKRMAARGDRKRLGTLMKDISQIVAEEIVEEQPGLKPKVCPTAMIAW